MADDAHSRAPDDDEEDTAPAIDPERVAALAALPEAEDELDPERTLDALLAEGPPRPGLDLESFKRLRRLKDHKKIYTAMAKALDGPIRELNDKLVEHILDADEDADFGHGWSATVADATAYTQVKDYPAYRRRDELDGAGQVPDAAGRDEGTGAPYAMADLIAALGACEDDDPALAELVRPAVHGGAWNAAVQDRVRHWRERISESGAPTDAQGRPVDAYGNVLTDDEAQDPTADELALPPAVRAIVRVSPQINIMFRRK